MKQYKNLLVSGCSFSQDQRYDGLGGTPPTKTGPGSNRFIEDEEYGKFPLSYPGFLAQKLQVTSFVNAATSGHGNILIAHSLLEFLNRFDYDPEQTLVVLNLSDPGRLDIPCNFDNKFAEKKYMPWTDTYIPYSYFDFASDPVDGMKKSMSIDVVEQLTSNTIELLFNYLQNKKIDFYFLTMNNVDDTCLKKVIGKFDKHYVRLYPGINMMDFCRITKTGVSETNLHPGIKGSMLIAHQIYKYIKQHEIQL